MNLKNIFNAITPENIKNIPLIQTAMDIFIENLEENSYISQDIKKIYESKNEELRLALIKTYLSSLYNILNKAQNNHILRAKLESNNLLNSVPIESELIKILNEEHVITNKAFKQKLGTKIGVEYAYNLAKYLESGETATDFQMDEVKPFHFNVFGSILKETYNEITKPLSHPIGFTFDYNQVIKEILIDLYGIIQKYNFNSIEVRCFMTYSFDVFTPDSDDTNVKADFLSRINPLTNEKFTEAQYYEQVNVNTDKIVQTFTEYSVDKRNYKSILFTDGTYLEQYTNPIDVNYMYYSDYLKKDYDNLIMDYANHCSLFLDYDLDFDFSYYDETEYIEEISHVTEIKENNNGNEDQKYYNLISGEYAFNVDGDEYRFAPGIDESMMNYDDYENLYGDIKEKYSVMISGKTSYTGTISCGITDDTGGEIWNYFIKPQIYGDFYTLFNVCMLKSDFYTLTASITFEGATKTTYIKSSGLNDFENNLRITRFINNENNTYTLSGIGIQNTNLIIELYADDITDKISTTATIGSNGLFEKIIDVSTLSGNIYKLNVYFDNDSTIYSYLEGDNFKIPLADCVLNLQPFKYDYGTPDYNGLLGYTPIVSTEDMNGIDSQSIYDYKKIGELTVDNTYANEDKNLTQYMIDNSFNDLSEIPTDIIINDGYIDGTDYEKCFSSDLLLQETFIDYGRTFYPIDTSDFIVVTSNEHCNDYFNIFVVAKAGAGYYLFTDEIEGFDFYFYTKDGWYLTTNG